MVFLVASLLLSAAVDLATQLAVSSGQPTAHSDVALAATRRLTDVDRSGDGVPFDEDDEVAVARRRAALFASLNDQLKDQEFKNEKLDEQKAVTRMIGLLIECLNIIMIVTQGVVGCLYKARVTDKRPEKSELLAQAPLAAEPHSFTVGLFSCCDSGSPLCWSLCCMPLRQGDTYAAAGVTGFWHPYLLNVAMLVLPGALALIGFPRVPLMLSGLYIFARWRHNLRAALGAPRTTNWRGFEWIKDCLPVSCCMLCSVAQEAQQVDKGQGTKVGLCCSMELVGHPLLVAQGRQIATTREMSTIA